MEINQELLKVRMMRGAVMGPADPGKAPVKYCAGKLDNGRPCRIVVLDGDYCIRHQKEIDALEAGAPLPPGWVERAQEEKPMAKHRCGIKGCTRPVKNAGDTCWQHKDLGDQVEAGLVEVDQPAVVSPAAGLSTDLQISPVEPHPPPRADRPLRRVDFSRHRRHEGACRAPSCSRPSAGWAVRPVCLRRARRPGGI